MCALPPTLHIFKSININVACVYVYKCVSVLHIFISYSTIVYLLLQRLENKSVTNSMFVIIYYSLKVLES